MPPACSDAQVTSQRTPHRTFYLIVRPPEAASGRQASILHALRNVHGILYAEPYPGGRLVQTMFIVTTASDELFPQDEMSPKVEQAVRLALEGRELPLEDLPPLSFCRGLDVKPIYVRIETNRKLRACDDELLVEMARRLKTVNGVRSGHVASGSDYGVELFLWGGAYDYADRIYGEAVEILTDLLS